MFSPLDFRCGCFACLFFSSSSIRLCDGDGEWACCCINFLASHTFFWGFCVVDPAARKLFGAVRWENPRNIKRQDRFPNIVGCNGWVSYHASRWSLMRSQFFTQTLAIFWVEYVEWYFMIFQSLHKTQSRFCLSIHIHILSLDHWGTWGPEA